MKAPTKKRAVETDILSTDYGVCTYIGKREHNQDEELVPSAPGALNGNMKLFAVADGMGGHPGGGIASRIACDRLSDFDKSYIRDKGIQRPADISRRLIEVVLRTGRAIRLQGLGNYDLADMGTTLSCLMLPSTHSVIVHVGDGRHYPESHRRKPTEPLPDRI
jgi:protein phosphatase